MVSSVINSKVLHITRFCFIQSLLFHYGLIANHNTYILGNWIKETLDNAYNFPGTLPPVKPVNDMSRQRMLNLQFLSLNLNISYFTSQTDYKVGTDKVHRLTRKSATYYRNTAPLWLTSFPTIPQVFGTSSRYFVCISSWSQYLLEFFSISS